MHTPIMAKLELGMLTTVFAEIEFHIEGSLDELTMEAIVVELEI